MSTLRLQPGPIVTPRLDTARAEVARLLNAARARLLDSGTAVTIEVLAEAQGRSVAAARQWVFRRRRAGELVTVQHDGLTLIPTFQLDEAFDLHEDAASLVPRLLERGMSSWSIWDWVQTPNAWLDGDVPARLLVNGDLAPLHRAIDGLFQDG